MLADPAATPYTTPEALTDAIDALLLVHTPPAIASVSVIVLPVHTVEGPEMVPAVAPLVTETAAVATAVPQLLVTE